MKIATGYDRADHEWYVEPTYCTTGLLSVEYFDGVTLDPACGQGNIVKTLREAGVNAFGSDIVRRVEAEPWFMAERDFLNDALTIPIANIVCNPPFHRAKGTELFIRRALSIATRKVAIFTDVKFLAGQRRASGLFSDTPPDRIWIINPRPSCPPGEYLRNGGEAKNGQADWCWLVWSLDGPRSFKGPTQLGWLKGERNGDFT